MKKIGRTMARNGSSAMRVGVRILAGVAILSLSLLAFQILRDNRPVPAQVQDRPPSRLVEVVEAQEVEVPRSFSGFGTTRAVRSATVGAEVSARVTSRPAEVQAGRWMEAGETIVRLDPEVFRERRNAAAGGLKALQADVESLEVESESTQERLRLSDQAITFLDNELDELVSALERGAAVQIEVDRLRRQRTGLELEREALRQTLGSIPSRRAGLQSRITSQRAELALAEIDLSRAVVTAPISGTLAEVFVDEGDSVSPGTALARIVDLNLIEAPVQIPASAARLVAPGDAAIVRESSTGGRSFDGVVSRIAPEVDPQSRTIRVYVEIRQEVDRQGLITSRDVLLPGQFVSGEVIADTGFRAIAVPRLAVNANSVMVVDPETGSAQPRTARVAYYTERRVQGATSTTQWAVLDASSEGLPDWMPPLLRAGEMVIVSNLDELPAGTPVRTERMGQGEL